MLNLYLLNKIKTKYETITEIVIIIMLMIIIILWLMITLMCNYINSDDDD